MRTRQESSFLTVTSEGALLPIDILQKIALFDSDINGLDGESYNLGDVKLNEAISDSWGKLLRSWQGFKNVREKLRPDESGLTQTRERWLLPLFRELGYGQLYTVKPLMIEEKSYPISHGWQHLPIDLVSFRTGLEDVTRNAASGNRFSPYSLVQEFLNRSPEHLWGLASNGLSLRLLRKNASLTRQAYVDFDLEAMFNGEAYADFVLFWLLCHQSRVESEHPAECWLERWSRMAQVQGVRVLNQLRNGVEEAINLLGGGFLAHPANAELREKLRSGNLKAQDYYNQVLRFVYRLIILFVAEDRDILFDPASELTARQRYAQYYSMGRLRRMAGLRLGTRHSDLFRALWLVMEQLGSEAGCQALGLPALNGFLFSAQRALPDLKNCALENASLLAAIRALAFTEEKSIRRTVDYKNLGAEELGSVYESLLELHPQLDIESASFKLASVSGNARKTSGSYYTPTSLIDCLLDSALDPVLAEASTRPDPEVALLALKVCDPACGSGHFLIAAAHRIAKRLAAVRTGTEEPGSLERRAALRDVIGHCIYGVDINPMAVELCKVSLWMEAIEPGKPLSFLDAHIQCGNSLLGTTPALLRTGIPDEAFKSIEGDDLKYCTEWKKRNKAQHSGQLSLFAPDLQPWERLGDLGTEMRKFEEISDDTVMQIHQKEAYYEHMRTSENYKNSKLWADIWCAAFVWKKTDEFAYPISEEIFRNFERNPFNIVGWMREEVERLARQYQFFHWHIAFPEVFSIPANDVTPENEQAGWSGGFDVVLGNPPWNSVEIDKEILADEKREIASFQGFISNSSLYKLVNKGRRNLYSLFAEMTLNFVKQEGRIGLILPSGIVTDKPNEEICKYLVKGNMIIELLDFENHGAFQAVHDQYRFCLLTISPNGNENNPIYGFLFRDVSDRTIPNKTWSISSKEIENISPTRFSIPCFSSFVDAKIVKNIYKVGITLSELQRTFKIDLNSALLLNFDNKSKAIKHESSKISIENNNQELFEVKWLKVYEGEYFHSFDHRYATYQENSTRSILLQEKVDPNWENVTLFVVSLSNGMKRWKELGNNSSSGYLGLRRQSRITDEFSSIAAILPQSVAEGSVSCFFGKDMDGIVTSLLCANFNSFVFNYIVRIRQNGPNLSKSIYEQIPLAGVIKERLTTPNKELNLAQKEIVSRVLELTYTSWDLQSFAQDCGYEGPPFRWHEERRFLLRCELEAIYFHLYGTSRDDVDYIMETFPITKRKDEKLYGEYRTKRVILEIYDDMTQAIESGQGYRTRLEPGPADPAVAHEPRLEDRLVAD